jgi:hypothetical protein
MRKQILYQLNLPLTCIYYLCAEEAEDARDMIGHGYIHEVLFEGDWNIHAVLHKLNGGQIT